MHTLPHVLHRMAELGGFSGGLCAAGGSDTVGNMEPCQTVEVLLPRLSPGTTHPTSHKPG